MYGKGSVFTFGIPQKVIDAAPIASVESPEIKHVLLLTEGGYMQNLLDMLAALKVDCLQISGGELLEAVDLSVYTHCIFDESLPDRKIRLLCGLMPDCRFAALKDMRHAMTVSDYHDTVLYLPVFVSELTRFLNKSDRNAEMQDTPAQNGGAITVHDVTALVVDDND